MTDYEASVRLAQEDSLENRHRSHLELWGDGPPFFSAATDRFWAALAGGVFSLAACRSCGDVHFPPRTVCPACWTADTVELVATPGLGRIASHTTLHILPGNLADLRPITMVAVDLDESVRLLTWLLPSRPESSVRIGDRCRIVIAEVGGQKRFVAELA